MNSKTVSMITQYASMILGVSLADVKEIFAIGCFAVSIALGLVNLVLTVIKAFRDGKITPEEIQEMQNQIQVLQQQLKEGDKPQDEQKS